MRKTNPPPFFKFGLQRTAGPYSWVKRDSLAMSASLPLIPRSGRKANIAGCLKRATSGLMHRSKLHSQMAKDPRSDVHRCIVRAGREWCILNRELSKTILAGTSAGPRKAGDSELPVWLGHAGGFTSAQ
jgi:hypothetical protein